MNINMSHKTFADIDIRDPFFQSLIDDYPGFENWFKKNINEEVFVQYNSKGCIEGLLSLKIERKLVDDVVPKIEANKILKVRTFKINSHGTRLGEQFIKIITDYAVNEDVDLCYVTIFPKHIGLINLIKRYGFYEYGKKGEEPLVENVYVKNMRVVLNNINFDFPMINASGTKKYMLSIYPKYHTIMFPDSILTTENKNIITDVSYTNSIHKIYVCTMGVEVLKYGDIIVLYRTAEPGRSAEYSAVATSVCVVEEVRLQGEFASFEDFYRYSSQYSVFDKGDLRYWYDRGGCKAIKLTYNAALKKRVVRHDLINKIGLDRDIYWGFFPLSDKQFYDIIDMGRINKKLIL